MAKALGIDPHSWANYQQVKVVHYNIVLRTDFAAKKFIGHVDVTAEVLEPGAEHLLLDFRDLAIHSVKDVTDPKKEIPVGWTVPKHDHLAKCLAVPLAEAHRTKGSKAKFRIAYTTSADGGAIQWLEPAQTSGKKHPFVFTQCEACLARTLLPCQDTPAVKAPYDIQVSVQSPMVVVCSGRAEQKPGEARSLEDGWLSYRYSQPVPIPAYLIAICAGALKSASVGPRSSVWCEPELLDAAVYEFSAETETFLQAGEKLSGVNYEWGVYDIVVLPPSFAFGGMENPQMTTLNPALIVGDRSLTNVVAHEISHSWTGNLVTMSSWKDFWLNEGFTVYLERLILGEVRHSEAYRHFEALLGYNDLIKTCREHKEENAEQYTKLVPDLTGVDPDDVFSKIPYEKGSLFLLYLETQVVGGKEPMLEWLHTYFETFRNRSLSTEEFREHFVRHFTQKPSVGKQKLDAVDWNTWLYGTGLPPFDPRPVLTQTLTERAQSLAAVWRERSGTGAQLTDLDAFSAKEKMYFLDLLLTTAMPMPHDVADRLDALYRLSSSRNIEILHRYLLIAMRSGQRKMMPTVADVLSRYGRGLYVRPLYRALIELDREFAEKVFNQNRSFYMASIANVVQALLKKK